MSILILLAVLGLTFVAATMGAWAALARRNRVVRGMTSRAPIRWLWSGRREAKLHRRLRRAGQRLALVPATDDVADITARLRVELVELDGHLVTIARRPSPVRRADRRPIQERVEEIEALVRRVEERTRSELVSLAELNERLDLLDAADRELDELDPTTD